MNRVIALFLLVLLSPLFIVVGLAIFLEDGAPVFFVQKRVGKDYSFFPMYKFRTMKKKHPQCSHTFVREPQAVSVGIRRFA